MPIIKIPTRYTKIIARSKGAMFSFISNYSVDRKKWIFGSLKFKFFGKMLIL
jgi:hypothetical protein